MLMISQRFKLVAISFLLTVFVLLVLIVLVIATLPIPSDPFQQPKLVEITLTPTPTLAELFSVSGG